VTAAVRGLIPMPEPAEVVAADEAVRAVLRTQFGASVPSLVIVQSVAGSGKTTLLVDTTVRVVGARGERVAVAANTDYQSFLLTRRLLTAGVPVVLFVAETKALPLDLDAAPAGLVIVRAERELRQLLGDPAARATAGLPDAYAIVANTAKWRSVPGADTPHRAGMRPVAPVLLVDEGFQMHDAMAEGVLTVGERWIVVGDSGQIDPPNSGDTSEWEHRPDGPHRPFPEAQLARTDKSSAGVVVLELPYTRRNPADGLPFIQPFYEQEVRSLVPTGSRRLVLDWPNTQPDGVDRVLEAVAAGQSVTSAVLPPVATGAGADVGMAEAISAAAHRLLTRHARVLVTAADGYVDLEPSHIMVIATHHDQLAQLRPLLPPGVQTGTADSLQGEDAPVVLAWHPLSGAAEPDTFHCDAGRTCVMLTRHQVGVVVFSRDGVAEMLEDQQPNDLLVPSLPRNSGRLAWRAQRQLFQRFEETGREHLLSGY
jgi:hypothetical protein